MPLAPEQPALPAEFAPPAEKFAATARLRLHYLEWGGGPRTVVCLPGTSMSAHCWAHLATALAGDFRVIALNQRGHGRSERPPRGYAIDDYRDDLAAFFDTLGLGSAALIGSSLGTQVAIAFAATNPRRVTGLVLSDPSCTIEQEAIDYYVKLHRERPRSFASYRDAYAFAHALPQRAGLASEALHQVNAMGDFAQRDDGRWEWCYDLNGILETFAGLTVDQWPQVKAIEAPVLILHAESSHVLNPQNAVKLARTFKKGRLIDLAGSSHTIWGDRPAELARHARAHLDTLDWKQP